MQKRGPTSFVLTMVCEEPGLLELSKATEDSKLSKYMSYERKLNGSEESLVLWDELADAKLSIDNVGELALLLDPKLLCDGVCKESLLLSRENLSEPVLLHLPIAEFLHYQAIDRSKATS